MARGPEVLGACDGSGSNWSPQHPAATVTAGDAVAASGVAPAGASTPSLTTPDRADEAERIFGVVAVWANCASYCATASGANNADPWLGGALLG